MENVINYLKQQRQKSSKEPIIFQISSPFFICRENEIILVWLVLS